MLQFLPLPVLVLLLLGCRAMGQQGGMVGVNWGTQLSHPLPGDIVVRMLEANNVARVKLFDADPNAMRALMGSKLDVMVGIPNDMLQVLATSTAAADSWVRQNVTRFTSGRKKVNIKYVAVGNEPFLTSYNGTFESVTLPALKNIQAALINANPSSQIKATVPLNADVLSNPKNPLPSGGIFRPEIQTLMLSIVTFLSQNGAPFTINLYPFISLQQNPNFPKEFAFFGGNASPIVDGSLTYTNVFDASYDLLVAALNAAGFANMSIIVGEVGWPTDGDINANVENARTFNQGLLQHTLGTQGTPMRPGSPLHVYIFGLIDEDRKSIAPGNFERHWGIFTYDGQAKYGLDLTGGGNANAMLQNAKGVDYLPKRWCVLNPSKQVTPEMLSFACGVADCTALAYGGSCNFLGAAGNASYAFNSYYQMTDQVATSCDFQGTGMVTTKDPSVQSCRFILQIVSTQSSATRQRPHSLPPLLLTTVALMIWVL